MLKDNKLIDYINFSLLFVYVFWVGWDWRWGVKQEFLDGEVVEVDGVGFVIVLWVVSFLLCGFNHFFFCCIAFSCCELFDFGCGVAREVNMVFFGDHFQNANEFPCNDKCLFVETCWSFVSNDSDVFSLDNFNEFCSETDKAHS